MPKDSQPSGFLSKMARFVRHPATSWSDLDTVSEGRDDGQSKQALKEMIERKRRNDFVRRREFEMLRKLRSRPVNPEPGYGGRPSFFQSSYSSKPDDRAGTLKKIDEIEAQMSMHWWKTKHGDAQEAHTTLPPGEYESTRAYRTTVNLNIAPTEPMATRHMEQEMPLVNAVPVPAVPAAPVTPVVSPVASAGVGTTVSEPPKTTLARPAEAIPAQSLAVDETQDNSGFSVSKFYAFDVQELALDPEIEEAAIRFASGDDAATEQGLLDTLNQKSGGGSPDEWMALFDFYRATGRLDAFESRAIDFASRFSRSAPQWVSMPEDVARRQAVAAQPRGDQVRAVWVADDEVDAHAATLLGKVLERTPQPWVLDWTAIKSIQPVAVERLQKLFAGWGASPVELRFLGARNLRDLLQRLTPSGDTSVDRMWWGLRLAVLRVMNQGDEFELAALDFCVTYEISPPSWEAPLCQFRSVSSGGSAALTEFDRIDTSPHALPDSSLQGLGTSSAASADRSVYAAVSVPGAPVAEMVGDIIGDPQEMLVELDERLGDAAVREISCRHLIRVDFSAAGSILNWVSAHQAQGREVRFVNVHRLIAAFFHVIGITEYAKVLTRDD